MSLVVGQDVNLYINYNSSWELLTCGKNCTYESTTEIAERTTSTSGTHKQFKALATSGRLQMEGDIFLNTPFTIVDLFALQDSLQSVMWSFEIKDTENHVHTYSGWALIETISQTGDVTSAAGFSISLVVDGEPFISSVPVPTTVTQVQRYVYTAVGGEIDFTALVLVNKDVLQVSEDTAVYDVVTTTPGNQQAKFTKASGKISFDHPLAPGEIIIVLYQ